MLSSITRINFPLLLLSLCIAVTSWYAITVKERVDMHLKVYIDYNNVPKHLIVTEGLVNEVTVQVRGPKTLLQSHDTKTTYAIDLSHLEKGKNIISFLQPDFSKGNFRAFEVLEISPPQAIVMTDTLLERNVPIKATIDTVLHSSAFKVKDMTISPSTGLLRGPEKIVSKVHSLPLELHMDTKEAAGTYTKKFPLVSTIEQSSVTPSFVSVTYTVTTKRTRVTVEKKVQVNGEPDRYMLSPQNLTVEVELPEGLAKNKSYLNGLAIRVTPPLLEEGQSATVQSQVSLPEGMTLITPPSQKVTITRRTAPH